MCVFKISFSCVQNKRIFSNFMRFSVLLITGNTLRFIIEGVVFLSYWTTRRIKLQGMVARLYDIKIQIFIITYPQKLINFRRLLASLGNQVDNSCRCENIIKFKQYLQSNFILKILIKFLKIIGLQKSITCIFFTVLICNKMLNIRNSSPTHGFLIFNISTYYKYSKSKSKVIRK